MVEKPAASAAEKQPSAAEPVYVSNGERRKKISWCEGIRNTTNGQEGRAKARFAELEGWESMEQIQDAYGYGEITADRRDKLTDLWEAREAARNSRKGSDKYHDLVTEMLETAIRRVGNEYADMLFEYDQQRREAEKQCEQLAMEGMMKK